MKTKQSQFQQVSLTAESTISVD